MPQGLEATISTLPIAWGEPRPSEEKLRQEALTEIRAVQKKEGSPDVDDLLFTSFVVQ